MSLDDPYQNFIAVSRYARWREEDNRRETWEETVERYIDFMSHHLLESHDYEPVEGTFDEIEAAIKAQEVGPSMRALMTAGPALERSHVAGYNCAFLPVDSPRSFDEALYVLMNGTGVGFSVEKQYVRQLPEVHETLEPTNTVIEVGDSKEGWAKAFRELIALLYAGRVPTWDLSKVRPAGDRLKVFGGRASGPAPLDELFRFTVDLFAKAAGRRLNTLEAHDLMCKVASVVVVGGVRRAALISLSDLDDARMAGAKTGDWYNDDFRKQRALSNNSVAYTSKPDMDSFMREWLNLYASKSGERGIFNRQAAQKKAAENGRREWQKVVGGNPCMEILLRSYQFCNLTTVVVRPEDTLDDLKRKVRLAATMGTWQSTLTNFKYLRKIWQKNTEEERLLGVSMTGQLGHPILSGQQGLDTLAAWLDELRQVAIDTNAEVADAVGIPRSAAVTCVKPDGTTSQLFGTSSGMHPWHNDYYLRTVRGDKKDPLTSFLIDCGVPHEDEIHNPAQTTVFTFPMKAPDGALTRKDLSAIEHLEIWLAYQRHWCEHKPSVTISVREHEWLEVGAWVYRHFDEVSGVSFLPYSEHIYQQAPYQDITKDEYEAWRAKMPMIRWEDLSFFEREDSTSGTQELACTAGGCDIV